MQKMEKKLLTFATGMLFTATVYGQVGINTNTPQSTLDINGVTTATVPDGILVPRFTVAELAGKDAAYGLAQNGTLVFVTSGTGIPNSKTSDITGTGFYYYDHPASKWKIVGGPSSSAVFDVTPEKTGSYTVTANDGYVTLNINTAGNVLTLPTTGIPIGKKIYVSNTGSEAMDISPIPRNTGSNIGSGLPLYMKVQAGSSGALIYLGGTGNGSWDWISGY
jgi:hypothetical protein